MSCFSLKNKVQQWAIIYSLICLLWAGGLLAGTAPPSRILSPEIMLDIALEFVSHYKVKPIGACYWLKEGLVPHISQTLEVSEWQPDLIVSVFNTDGNGVGSDNPWWEASVLLDPPAKVVAHSASRMTTGFDYTTGHNTSNPTMAHYGNIRHKVVDVVGSPFMVLDYPLKLKANTTAFMPYYQSEYDALQERSGLAEWLTRPIDVMAITHPIGNAISHWGYEFPRSMTVDNTNNFKASMVVAIRAADLVTNLNTLHTVVGVSDSCGQNCVVSNVTEKTSMNGKVRWQMVYPTSHFVQIGQDDSILPTPLEQASDLAGNGNYVFVIWRHYEGCIQHRGKFLFATREVKPTIKR